MKLKYSLLAAILGAILLIVKQFWPDFPLDLNTLLALIVYVLAKLGVEIVEVRAQAFFAKFK